MAALLMGLPVQAQRPVQDAPRTVEQAPPQEPVRSVPARAAVRAAAAGLDTAQTLAFPEERRSEEPVVRIAPRIALVDAAPGSATYEMTVAWTGTLAARAARLTSPSLLLANAAGGWRDASTSLPLPTRDRPRVDVLAADFDEVALPAGADLERWVGLDDDLAQVQGIGTERKQAMGTLRVGVLRADSEAGVLRRYRRVVVRVTYAAPFATGRTAETSATNPLLPRAFAQAVTSPHVAVERSVLADGTWFKLPIAREGVYRIDADYLNSLGLNPSNVRVDRLQIYGNGGAPLPALNSDPRVPDLTQNAVWTQGGPTFADGGALYFFAEAPNGWRYSSARSDWEHYVNPFTTTTSYFVHVGADPGARVATVPFPSYADAQRRTQFVNRFFVEEDLFMAESSGGGSGLDWLGQDVVAARPVRTVLDTTLAGRIAGAVRYEALTATRANPAAGIQFERNEAVLGSVRSPSVQLNTVVGNYASSTRLSFEEDLPAGQSLQLDFRIIGSQNNPTAYLNWLRVFAPRQLQAQGGYLRFHTPGGEAGRFEFVLSGFASAPQVWDITQRGAARALAAQSEGNTYVVQVDVTDPTAPRELVAFVPTAERIGAPPEGRAVDNQNLHGLTGYPDFIIVTHADFRTAAEALATYRRDRDGLNVFVVDIEQVYNEFSGGHVDMRAVRDFMKFLYDRADTPGRLPDYLLLFGDGHYDFRGIQAGFRDDGRVTDNYVPMYESDVTLQLEQSYTSDDYFGLLDDEEGIWEYGSLSEASFERVDTGVGRLPVRTLAEAEALVAKIQAYEDPANFGSWRTRYTFLSDDNNPSPGDADLHLQNIDAVAVNAVGPSAPAINQQKIYTLSYTPEVTAVGRRYPQASADAVRAINEGTLIWNYAGHGGIERLADESLLDREAIANLTNVGRPTLCITATCSFGRMDMIDEQSAAERMLLLPEGGGIAMLTTLRVVFTSASLESLNTALNLRLNEALFVRDADGRPRRLGDIVRTTKNTDDGAESNNRKFALLGDPTMRVGLPTRTVRLTTINGAPISPDAPPELRALARTEVEGEVLRLDGTVDTAFEGEVEVTVFDAARQVAIPEEAQRFQPRGEFEVRNDRLFQGRASASQGRFRVAFVVPRDVSYSGAPGRISVYARSATIDGAGATEDVVISTTAGTGGNDTTGPRMALRFATEADLNPDAEPAERTGALQAAFVDGGLVGAEPTLVVRLEDETGINTVGSGVGHQLLLTIDGDAAGAIDIGSFYEGDLNDAGSGTIRFALPEQTEGPHSLTVRAWDVANNSTEATLSYVVAADEDLVIRNVLNYPNPTPGPTDFVFEHNQPPGTPARVQLRIYTLSGRPVVTLDDVTTLPSGTLDGNLVRIPWQGLDDDFDRLASGVYLYRLRVEVERTEGERQVAERIERLAIIR
ncbi:MAG: type IX secretion system sortase PorU [Bacteroidota bacterium]